MDKHVAKWLFKWQVFLTKWHRFWKKMETIEDEIIVEVIDTQKKWEDVIPEEITPQERKRLVVDFENKLLKVDRIFNKHLNKDE